MSASDTPKPAPKPAPTPGRPSPAALAGKKPTAPLIPAAPPQQEYDEADIAEALTFGTVRIDGTVTVQDGTQVRALGPAGSRPEPQQDPPAVKPAPQAAQEEKAEEPTDTVDGGTAEERTADADQEQSTGTDAPAVGEGVVEDASSTQEPTASTADADSASAQDESSPTPVKDLPEAPGDHTETLRPYAEAYLDLVAFLDLTQKRLDAPEHTQNDLNRLLENLRKNMKEPQVIGDIPALRARASALREQAKEKIHAIEAERAEARERATEERTRFVEGIEELVGKDPEQISWKATGETMRQMVPTWKQMQSEGASLERSVEDALWKRLSAARATFDRKRKKFFSKLDDQHAEAARVKEELIAQAESMKDSTDWGPTVRAFKDLMSQWRQAPRGQRKKDDAQWARFKAAQDTFFEARNADLAASDEEQRRNLEVKEGLLAEAERIDTKDLDAAKESLRSIQDRWEDAGKVPRSDMRRVEDRLRAVERKLKKAEEAEWRRTDPRTKARVEGASSQLHSAIAGYEEELEKARATGDPKKIEKAEAALEARKEWLAVIERSARELG